MSRSPSLCDIVTNCLMYVDDETLKALTTEDMKQKIKIKEQYLRKNGSIANVGKTAIMICHDPEIWEITIAPDGKSAIMKNKRSGNTENAYFQMDNQTIEIVNMFKYLGSIYQHDGRYEENAINRCKLSELAMYKSLNITQHTRQMPVDVKNQINEGIITNAAVFGCEVTPFTPEMWNDIRHHHTQLENHLGKTFSKNATDYITASMPFELRALSNRIGFLAKIMNQQWYTLGTRAFLQSLVMAMKTKKGWLYETIEYCHTHDIKFSSHIGKYHIFRYGDCKQNNMMAIKHARKFKNDNNIYKQVQLRWEKLLDNTIREEHNQNDTHDKKYTWFIHEIIMESACRGYDSTSPSTQIRNFYRSIRDENDRICFNQLVCGAWKLGRIMAGNNTIATNWFHNDEAMHNNDTFRRKCPICWIRHAKIELGDERHVLFECQEYEHIRNKWCDKIKELGVYPQRNVINFQETFWDTVLQENDELCTLDMIQHTYHTIVNTLTKTILEIRRMRTSFLDTVKNNRKRKLELGEDVADKDDPQKKKKRKIKLSMNLPFWWNPEAVTIRQRNNTNRQFTYKHPDDGLGRKIMNTNYHYPTVTDNQKTQQLTLNDALDTKIWNIEDIDDTICTLPGNLQSMIMNATKNTPTLSNT